MLWGVEIPTALLLALDRFFFSAMLLLFAVASYGFWGNPDSPLRGWWRVGVAFGVLWLVAWLGHHLFLKRLKQLEKREEWSYLDPEKSAEAEEDDPPASTEAEHDETRGRTE